MDCPYCSHDDLKVTDKRGSPNGIRRRRECLKCGKRFTTYERIEPFDLYVIKKDGRRERYNRDKLLLGIVKACEKREISPEKIDEIVNQIEEKLRKKGKEVTTKAVGELVMNALKKLDKVAYIRFASVYRKFDDVNDFRKEIKEVGK
ncbi:MAG: transcriptional regulator NrdR [Nanoarchaeota archaeon]|nr:transcriptional regulator NrdR [Nanoarchaeota archaeon]